MNEKKQNILDKGLTAFAENTYEETSLNHILEAAEVSKGTFYHYFKDKMDLYQALVGLCLNKKRDFLTAGLNPDYAFDMNDDFFTAIKKQTLANIDFLKAEPVYYKFSLQISAESEEVKTAIRQKHGWQLDGGLGDMVDLAYLKGEFNTAYPKGFVKNIVGHLMTHYYYLLFPADTDISEDTIEGTLDLYFKFLKHGLTAKK